MINQLDNDHPETQKPNQDRFPASGDKKTGKKLYVLGAGIIIIAIIAVAIFIPRDVGNSIQLSLNYGIGERMVYNTTNTVTNQLNNPSIDAAMNPTSASYNSTSAYEVISFDGETYTLNVTLTSIIQGSDFSLPPITTKVNKADYYRDLLPSGAPQFFSNVSANPTLSAYLANSQVNVGESWSIPVSTGNSSLGLTGELTLKFAEMQEITVPAGTYRVFRIEVSSSKLDLHADPDYLNTIHLTIPENMSLQLSGNTYLEQGTCRLIKSELTQETASQPNGVSSTSIIYSEKILVEHTKP